MIAILKEAHMKISPTFAAAVLAVCVCSSFAQKTPEEQAVWNLEHAYWDDVTKADMVSYLALWHQDFVGWPSFSPKPVRKDHITDWLGAYTAKGLHLKKYELEPADSQTTNNIVVTYYWLTAEWVDKEGHGERTTNRITHTWIRSGKNWQILAGMSAETKLRNKNQ